VAPQRDALWVTPDTREALVALTVAWRLKIERLGTMNFPGRLACPGTQPGRRGVSSRRHVRIGHTSPFERSAKLDQAVTYWLASPSILPGNWPRNTMLCRNTVGSSRTRGATDGDQNVNSR
jgi:hypothetical protein